MVTPKKVVIPAVLGFVLSFLISLISTHNFGVALLRGIIFGVVFVLLVYGISFLYDKFLSDGTESKSSAASTNPTQHTGSVVDITIDDEKLKDEDQGPQFYVANNKHHLDSEDMVDIKKKDEQNEQIDDIENEMDSRAKESVADVKNNSLADAIAHENKSAGTGLHSGGGSTLDNDANDIDSLPDIGEFVPESNDSEGTDDKDIIKDSDFAVEGESSSIHPAEFPDGSNAKNHDTETMAKAIRTLLKKDE